MQKAYLQSTVTVKGIEKDPKDNSDVLKIAGYANFSSKDRSNEVILPSAWKTGIENYKKNPVLLYQHDMSKPIGTVTKLSVDDNGLFIEANVSSAAEKLYQVQTLIRDGALKAFSVGFNPKKGRKDTNKDILYITELELLENSIVSIPMNQDSLFSIQKAFDSSADYEKFLKESVEEFDSANDEQFLAETLGITKEDLEDVLRSDGVTVDIASLTGDQKAAIVAAFKANPGPTVEEISTIVAPAVTTNNIKTIVKPEELVETLWDIEKVNKDPFWTLTRGFLKANLDGKDCRIVKLDYKNDSISLQEVSILGNPINEILNIDINTLNVLNLGKVNDKDYISFKTVEVRSIEDITKAYKELVNINKDALREVAISTKLSVVQQKQLSRTMSLMNKPIENWNSDDFKVANKIVDYIQSRSQMEADELTLKLHGHVEEKSEMTNPVSAPAAEEEITQVANSAPAEAAPAPVATTEVSEPRVLGLVNAVGTAMAAVDTARDIETVSPAQLKALEDKLDKLLADYGTVKDKVAAAHNEKVVFAVNNGPAMSEKELRSKITNAMFLMHAKNPTAPLSMQNFMSTNFGKDLVNQTKATITTVDVLITGFTNELYEQMQMELKIAPTLRVMDVNAQNFKIPVADEDINGDIAMFENGTYNLGETDSTRVPTTRQNSITAINLTPHKFMGTTHLAKDEQEDVLIPLLDFQIRSLTRRMARSVDKSLLRGDGSLSGFTASPSATISGGSTGMPSVINGLTNLAWAQSGLRVSTGGTTTKATPASIASARAVLLRYGLDVSANLVYFTSIEGYNDLVTTSDFRTIDKFGPNATYLTGQVGAIYGIPVVVTEFLDNVGVSGNHVGLLVYIPGFIVGRRRAFEVESWYDPRRQLTAIYLSTRFDMKALTTNANAALDATKYPMAAVVHSA